MAGKSPLPTLTGWQLNGLWTWESGLPLLFSASSTSLNAPGNTQWPQLVAPAQILGNVGPGQFWFTASSFANPAVTVARCLTKTFSGIRLADVPGFIAAQLVGAALATALFRWLQPVARDPAPEVPGRCSAAADLVEKEAP